MNTKSKILLVGPGPKELLASPGFKATVNEAYELVVATNAEEAIPLFADSEFIAVVTDFNLPDSSGTAFLDSVMDSAPNTHRFLLADLADRETSMKCVGTAHTFIPIPCSGEKMVGAIDRAKQVAVWLASDALHRLARNFTSVPSPPSTYFQIVKELASATSSLENVGEIIAQDPAVSSKLLQLVNSVVFGLQRQVASPSDAVMFLGLETTKSMVLLAHSYSHFDQLSDLNFSVEALWQHCLTTSRFARAIASSEMADHSVSDQAFTAGLLHDIGKLVLAINQPEQYAKVAPLASSRKIPTWEAELEIFGVSHAEVGAWLIATWGLPLPIVEAIAMHHHPTAMETKQFTPLTALHVANAIEHQVDSPYSRLDELSVDEHYLTDIGLEDRIKSWSDACHDGVK